MLGLPLLAVLGVAALGIFGKRLRPELAAYAVPLNLGLVYGHMLDGFASFIAICSNPRGMCGGASIFGLDLPAYSEKHPVSNLLLGVGDGWVFPMIKLGLVLAIVWALDIAYRKDLEKDRQLGGLVKMAILILGLAPGLRDYIRLALGT